MRASQMIYKLDGHMIHEMPKECDRFMIVGLWVGYELLLLELS